jgi:hypothetical protein
VSSTPSAVEQALDVLDPFSGQNKARIVARMLYDLRYQEYTLHVMRVANGWDEDEPLRIQLPNGGETYIDYDEGVEIDGRKVKTIGQRAAELERGIAGLRKEADAPGVREHLEAELEKLRQAEVNEAT